MMPTLAIDLTSMLAPFGCFAAGFVIVGLGVVIVKALRAERPKPARGRGLAGRAAYVRHATSVLVQRPGDAA